MNKLFTALILTISCTNTSNFKIKQKADTLEETKTGKGKQKATNNPLEVMKQFSPLERAEKLVTDFSKNSHINDTEEALFFRKIENIFSTFNEKMFGSFLSFMDQVNINESIKGEIMVIAINQVSLLIEKAKNDLTEVDMSLKLTKQSITTKPKRNHEKRKHKKRKKHEKEGKSKISF